VELLQRSLPGALQQAQVQVAAVPADCTHWYHSHWRAIYYLCCSYKSAQRHTASLMARFSALPRRYLSLPFNGALQLGFIFVVILVVAVIPSMAMIVDIKDLKVRTRCCFLNANFCACFSDPNPFQIPVGKWDIRQQTMYSLAVTPVGHGVPYIDVNCTFHSLHLRLPILPLPSLSV